MYRKEYYIKNKNECIRRCVDWAKKRRKESISFRILSNLRTRIQYAIRSDFSVKSKRTLELLGCSMIEFKKHLSSQFKEGMSWKNYGVRGWHMDHIRPCASFDLTDPKQQEECFHHSNYQPLWWFENLSKGDKYPKLLQT